VEEMINNVSKMEEMINNVSKMRRVDYLLGHDGSSSIFLDLPLVFLK